MIKRLITSILGIALLVSVLYFLPSRYFFFTVLCAIVISLFEFFKITEKSSFLAPFCFSVVFALFSVFIFSHYSEKIILLWMVALVIVCFLYLIMKYDSFSVAFPRAVKFFTANIYITIFLCFAIPIFRRDQGNNLVMMILLIAWATDSVAFLFGKRFGKVKLYPTLSPKKTVEGAVAGICAGIVAGMVFNLFTVKIEFLKALVIVFFTSIFCVLGDLFESMIKRVYNVKDSGNIIPGHGGIMDRIDSLFFAVPVFFMLMEIMLK